MESPTSASENAVVLPNPPLLIQISKRSRDQDEQLERQIKLQAKLTSNAKQALGNTDDEHLQQLLKEHPFPLDYVNQPDEDAVVRMIVEILRRTDLYAREAAIKILQSGFDVVLAQESIEKEKSGEDGETINQTAISGEMEQMEVIGSNDVVEAMTMADNTSMLMEDNEAKDSIMTGTEENSQSAEDDNDDENEERSPTNNGGSNLMKQMRDLNPNVDRAPAKQNHPDNSKLQIRLLRPSGRSHLMNYPSSVNWTQAKSLKDLNRWRSQNYRHHLGPVGPLGTDFHDEERQWLIDVHVAYRLDRRAKHLKMDWLNMNFKKMTDDFNATFQGQVLEDGSRPRPARVQNDLITERARIEEIVDLTKGKLER